MKTDKAKPVLCHECKQAPGRTDWLGPILWRFATKSGRLGRKILLCEACYDKLLIQVSQEHDEE